MTQETIKATITFETTAIAWMDFDIPVGTNTAELTTEVRMDPDGNPIVILMDANGTAIADTSMGNVETDIEIEWENPTNIR